MPLSAHLGVAAVQKRCSDQAFYPIRQVRRSKCGY